MRRRPYVLAGITVGYLVWSLLPVAIAVLFSFNANRYGTFPFTGWTGHWYREAFVRDVQQHLQRGHGLRSL